MLNSKANAAANLSALTWMIAKDDAKGKATTIVAAVPAGLERDAQQALFTLGKEDEGLFKVENGLATVDGAGAIARLAEAGVQGPVMDAIRAQLATEPKTPARRVASGPRERFDPLSSNVTQRT